MIPACNYLISITNDKTIKLVYAFINQRRRRRIYLQHTNKEYLYVKYKYLSTSLLYRECIYAGLIYCNISLINPNQLPVKADKRAQYRVLKYVNGRENSIIIFIVKATASHRKF